MPLFAVHGFSCKRDNEPHLKFSMKKGVLLIYRMMPQMLNFKDDWPTFEPSKSAAVLRLNAGFREAHYADILQSWYLPIDIHCILLHVKFEDGLSISVLKKKQLVTKIHNGESKKLLNGRPLTLFLKPRLSRAEFKTGGSCEGITAKGPTLVIFCQYTYHSHKHYKQVYYQSTYRQTE
jgi:hypothetical protein